MLLYNNKVLNMKYYNNCQVESHSNTMLLPNKEQECQY